MAINMEYYSDSKAARAHVAFQLVAILSLLSKDSITTSQSIASIFFACSLPLLIVALTLLPEEDTDMDSYPKKQYMWGASTLGLGHFTGLAATASVLWGFNIFAGVIFIVLSSISVLVFMIFLFNALGESGWNFFAKHLGEDFVEPAKEIFDTDKKV